MKSMQTKYVLIVYSLVTILLNLSQSWFSSWIALQLQRVRSLKITGVRNKSSLLTFLAVSFGHCYGTVGHSHLMPRTVIIRIFKICGLSENQEQGLWPNCLNTHENCPIWCSSFGRGAYKKALFTLVGTMPGHLVWIILSLVSRPLRPYRVTVGCFGPRS